VSPVVGFLPDLKGRGIRLAISMEFGDISHRGLTPFDVASLHDVPAYPLPHAALESLPAHVRADLERDGAIQLFAVYDRDAHEFEDVALAWEE
jgi:hypothetical protein